LYQNYPNPFNKQTIIKYYLPDIGYQPAEIKLEIYDLLGRRVRALVDERQYPGEYTATWDGKSESGDDLPSGVYFYRLFVSKAEFSKPRKLVLMK
jgi:flagellar hook assembly protein FlgD